MMGAGLPACPAERTIQAPPTSIPAHRPQTAPRLQNPSPAPQRRACPPADLRVPSFLAVRGQPGAGAHQEKRTSLALPCLSRRALFASAKAPTLGSTARFTPYCLFK